jgi:tetratricopeptide (TPR) repeat protein
VHAAAVLGQTFTAEALAAVSGRPEAELPPRLRALVQREILSIDVDPRSPERGQYGFTQGLIREVAYGTLGKRDRRARHLAAARYFEALGEEELAGVLASHYLAAYRAAPDGPEGDAIASQARLALRGAADRAAAVHDSVGAAASLELAREVTPDAAERAALGERRAELLRIGGRLVDAEAASRLAITDYETLGDAQGAARAATGLGLVLIDEARPVEAIPILEQAVSVLDADVPHPEVASALAVLARAYVSAGSFDQARVWVARAIRTAEGADARRPLVDAIITSAWVAASDGRARENFALLTGAIELARRYELPQEQLRAMFNLSASTEEDPDRLAELSREMHAVATRFGYANGLLYAQVNDLWLNLFWGDWDRVRALETVLGVPDDRMASAQTDTVRLFMAAMRGEFVEAERLLERIFAAYEGVTKANELTNVQVATALLRLSQGRLEESFEAAMAALANPESATTGAQSAAHAAFWLKDPARTDAAVGALDLGSPTLRYGAAVRAEVVGLQAAVHGDLATARRNLRSAIEQFRSLRQPISYALDDLALVRILGVADPDGRAAADEACEVFTRLGLKPYLEWLDRAIAESTPNARLSGRSEADVVPVPLERA